MVELVDIFATILSTKKMDDDAIIQERVTRPEQPIKRIQKLCMETIEQDNAEKIDTTGLFVEIEHYKALLARLRLQMDVCLQETEAYTEQKARNEAFHAELLDKTRNLEAQLQTAQASRLEKEKLNQLVAEMIRPKQVAVDSFDNDAENKEQNSTKSMIIAQLNIPRHEEAATIEALREEIAELEQQKIEYTKIWDVKRAKFQEMLEALGQFKDALLEKGSVDEEDNEAMEEH